MLPLNLLLKWADMLYDQKPTCWQIHRQARATTQDTSWESQLISLTVQQQQVQLGVCLQPFI